MIPLVASSTLSMFAWPATVDSDPSDHTGGAGPLSSVDDLFFVAAVAVLVLFAGLWLARSRRNPLISAPERPNSVRGDALGLAIAAYFAAAMLLSALVGLFGNHDDVIAALVIGNGAHLAGIGGCLFVAATRFDCGAIGFCYGRREGDSLRWGGLAAGMSVVAIAMCPLLRDATASLILFFRADFEFRTHPTLAALHDASQPLVVKVAFWVGAALIAPVAEEFFFRGLLQTFFVKVFRDRWVAIIVAAILFGAVHYTQPSAIPALVLLGILLGFAYEKSGALIWPVAIHTAFNLKTLVWGAIGGGT